MNLQGKCIILTGATGGIGQPLAFALASKGAKLALVGRDYDAITAICKKISQTGGVAISIITDFQATEVMPNPAQYVINEAILRLGELDMLINSAGTLDFTLFSDQSEARIAQMIHINTIAPIQLARAILPDLLEKNSGQIVNIGSIFGSIGFPHYATYCASKFALHGFSQALRRELVDSNIAVTYIAPRATKTPMNDHSKQMLAATKTTLDEPEKVVAEIIKAIETEKHEHYIGQPESFFAWLNGVLPSLVNIGLKKQVRIARPFALRENSLNH
jgi:short-subunit dehydrogenase